MQLVLKESILLNLSMLPRMVYESFALHEPAETDCFFTITPFGVSQTERRLRGHALFPINSEL